MSHAVLRGCPTKAQLYLDTLLDVTRESLEHGNDKKERCQVNLAEIIFYSMKSNIDGIFMINGASGETISNRQILSTSMPLTLALSSHYEAGTIIMLVMRNHQYMAATYYASIFANVVPLLVDPNSTEYELRHFIKLVSPSAIFCDRDRYDDVKNALNNLVITQTAVIISDDPETLEDFFKGHIMNLESYQVHRISQATPKTDALLIPTSGSTGLPKATILTHGSLVAQIPTIWIYHNSFPKPEKLALLLSTAQWMTYTILMTTCPVYRVSLLMTPKKPTSEHVLKIIEKYRPTWGLFGPIFAKSVAALAVPSQLSSLGTIVTTGAPLTENIVMMLKEKLPQSASLRNGIGMTETQSFIAISGSDKQWTSNGKIANVILYKIVSEDSKELGANEKGELLLKSDLCLFKGYYKNEDAYKETVTTDGWYKTGDVVYRDDNENIYFVERKKFSFKYLNHHVAPEEVENVISSVEGVQESVVVETATGPAAAVVLRESNVDRKDEIQKKIHHAVDSTLSDHKRLRGGIVFVSSLPCTHSGKINRNECKIFVNTLKQNKQNGMR